ncbi:nucleotide-sugar transporter [Neocallimastix lanati (nom. inval.)]|nr:nucleotide-sugar transporter [Neocallimastix sp. JGI-2020a]
MSSINIKYISLVILVIHNSLSLFVMRYSKTFPDKYLSSTAVVCSELCKLIISMFIHIIYRCKQLGSIKKYNCRMLIDELFGKESDCIKIMVPAVLYLIQNNLLYFSASKLDAATLQITSQMKLVVVAIFSVLILKRQLHKRQWFSIFLLAVGIALVQFPTGDNTTNIAGKNAMVDKTIGFCSVLTTCLTSGFAGVYFEKILKKSKVTLWARNVQLSLFSVIPGYFIGCLIMDGSTIKEKGFFGGYNRWTLFSIFCQSVGGIIIAIVVKYADNILKGFANSLSIVLSCIISYFLFDFNITLLFIIGCGLVLLSSYLYGKKKITIINKYKILLYNILYIKYTIPINIISNIIYKK